jgi:FtsP/CotA-like multicopper oxidase with cupredoxin domain
MTENSHQTIRTTNTGLFVKFSPHPFSKSRAMRWMHMCIHLFLAAGLWAVAPYAQAATRNYTIYITPGDWTINGAGGATLKVWTYSDVSGVAKVPAPVLTGVEGDTFNVTVYNGNTINHNFLIKGLTTDTTAIAPGATKTYTFTASSTSAGTYLYYDTLNSNINREMGMYGMLWIGPADGSAKAWSNGPAYSFQRLWVTSDMDKPRWNDVAGTGGTVSTGTYKPNYFMINGLGGFDAMHDMGRTMIDGSVGQTALVRIVNPGQFSYSLHFHMNHFSLLTVNGVRQSSPYTKLDVVNIPPLGTADLLLYLDKVGKYPMHVHTAQMETANGVYLNGAVTMIEVK